MATLIYRKMVPHIVLICISLIITMLNIFPCAYWPSAWKWPLISRTGTFSSFRSGCSKFTQLGDKSDSYSGLRPTRFQNEEASNSKCEWRGPWPSGGPWGVKEGRRQAAPGWPAPGGAFQVSESTDSKSLAGYGRWLTQMKRLRALCQSGS